MAFAKKFSKVRWILKKLAFWLENYFLIIKIFYVIWGEIWKNCFWFEKIAFIWKKLTFAYKFYFLSLDEFWKI